jgi:hypothetical protein
VLSTAPSGASPVELARALDEVRREIDTLTARRAVATDLEERVDIIHALQMAGRRLVALEEQQAVNNWERRG